MRPPPLALRGRRLAAAASRPISSSSTVTSRPPSTTVARRTSNMLHGPRRHRARARPPGPRCPRDARVVDPPQRDVGELAGLERADLVVAAQARGRRRASPISSASRTVSAAGPPRGRGEQQRLAQLLGQRARRPRCEAAPSTPSPTGRPASSRSDARARCPRRAGALEDGQCATPVPVSPNRAMLASSSACSGRARRPRPASRASSMYSTGAQPNCSRQNSSSSMVSARWVCSRTPLRRASSAASLISSAVTENGEHGATRDAQHRAGRRVVVAVDRGLAGGQDRRRGPRPRRRAAGRRRDGPGPSTRGTGGSASRSRAAASISAAEQVAAAAREDVVVVGRGRAARRASAASPPRAARPTDVLVDARPDRVQRREPLEQRGSSCASPRVAHW